MNTFLIITLSLFIILILSSYANSLNPFYHSNSATLQPLIEERKIHDIFITEKIVDRYLYGNKATLDNLYNGIKTLSYFHCHV